MTHSVAKSVNFTSLLHLLGSLSHGVSSHSLFTPHTLLFLSDIFLLTDNTSLIDDSAFSTPLQERIFLGELAFLVARLNQLLKIAV